MNLRVLAPYRFMFGEECTLPMNIGLPHRHPDPAHDVASPYAVWVKDSLEVAFDQVRHSGRLGNALLPSREKVQIRLWAGPYLIVATLGWTVGIQRHPDEPVGYSHCLQYLRREALRRFRCWALAG